jgi:hypothetical protein
MESGCLLCLLLSSTLYCPLTLPSPTLSSILQNSGKVKVFFKLGEKSKYSSKYRTKIMDENSEVVVDSESERGLHIDPLSDAEERRVLFAALDSFR